MQLGNKGTSCMNDQGLFQLMQPQLTSKQMTINLLLEQTKY